MKPERLLFYQAWTGAGMWSHMHPPWMCARPPSRGSRTRGTAVRSSSTPPDPAMNPHTLPCVPMSAGAGAGAGASRVSDARCTHPWRKRDGHAAPLKKRRGVASVRAAASVRTTTDIQEKALSTPCIHGTRPG